MRSDRSRDLDHVLRRNQERVEAKARLMTDEQLMTEYNVTPWHWRQDVYYRELRAREERRRPKSCWEWLRSPAI